VHVVDCAEKLINDVSDLNLGPPPSTILILLETIARCEERPAFADGHDDVDALLVLEELMNRNDVRMLKLTHDVDLVEVGFAQLWLQ
jgi:hypothetical protein